jgi:hypothetical protein
MKVLDNGGKTMDRYSIVVCEGHYVLSVGRRMHHYLGLSDNPEHPLGFSQWGVRDAEPDGDEVEIDFDALPEVVKKHVLERLEDD